MVKEAKEAKEAKKAKKAKEAKKKLEGVKEESNIEMPPNLVDSPKSKSIAKKDLEAVAVELSTVMEFEDPISTGKTVTVESLIADIKEASLELEETDVISDKTIVILEELGVTLPWVIEPADKKEPEAKAKEKVKVIEIDKPVTKIFQKNPEVEVRNDMIETLISKGKFTQKEIVGKVLEKFPSHSLAGITTVISDSKNAKYNKFKALAKMDSDTKILSF